MNAEAEHLLTLDDSLPAIRFTSDGAVFAVLSPEYEAKLLEKIRLLIEAAKTP